MKSCGVIVEYNPFHNGHVYHLQQAKKQSQSDVLIAVMSGNFLQRGEPAIVDKWTRANEALVNGADIVIELPFAYAVQSADYFAKGGVKLLQALQVDGLCFGTDSKASIDYKAFGEFSVTHREKIDETFREMKNNGLSYPQQMTEVYRTLYPSWSLDFQSPNHILAMGYAKENANYPHPMTLYPIRRKDAEYHDTTLGEKDVASATSIRETVLHKGKEEVVSFVPEQTYHDLLTMDVQTWEDFWALLKYQLLTSSVMQLQNVYQMVEGIEYRMKEKVVQAQSFDEFVGLVKTKRYTRTRIQRLCTYLLHQVTEKEIQQAWEETSVRVLGFNEVGRQFLNERKKTTTLPIITNVNDGNREQVALDIRSGQIYQLAHENIPFQDYYRQPIYKKIEK